jgi:hypothetical protein
VACAGLYPQPAPPFRARVGHWALAVEFHGQAFWPAPAGSYPCHARIVPCPARFVPLAVGAAKVSGYGRGSASTSPVLALNSSLPASFRSDCGSAVAGSVARCPRSCTVCAAACVAGCARQRVLLGVRGHVGCARQGVFQGVRGLAGCARSVRVGETEAVAAVVRATSVGWSGEPGKLQLLSRCVRAAWIAVGSLQQAAAAWCLQAATSGRS